MSKLFFNKVLAHLDEPDCSANKNNVLLGTSILKLICFVVKLCKTDLLTAKIFSLLSSLLTMVIFTLSGYLLGNIYSLSDSNNIIIFICLFILIISACLFTYICEIKFFSINTKVLATIIPCIKSHILSLPMSTINQWQSADLHKILCDYENTINNVVSTFLSLLNNLTLLILIMTFMFYCDLKLSLLYLFTYLALNIIKLFIYPNYILNTNLYLSTQGAISSFLNECILQIHKIRTVGIMAIIHRKWLTLSVQSKIYLEKASLIDLKIWFISSMTSAAMILILYGYLYLLGTNIDTTTTLMFLMCSAQLSMIFEKLSAQLTIFANALPAMNRLAPLLIETSEQQGKSTNSLTGNIELKNISLIDSKSNKFILNNVSLSIKPGTFTAVTGASGAGKSSIFKLILGLIEPTNGNISINKTNLKDIDLRTYRKQFGVVLQTTNIFPGTIYSNIAANMKITLDEAWELAKMVGLEDEIDAMPMKMFTHVSDTPGDSVSGGQKQKILIARALATKPTILLLDEATSALDNKSQATVIESLKKLNITLVVIAHRHNTIFNADVIYYLEKGRMIDKGSFIQLTKKLNMYKA